MVTRPILFIEDSVLIARSLLAQLTVAGLDVRWVPTCADALTFIQGTTPQALICAHHLPDGRQGTDLAVLFPTIPAVILTDCEDEGELAAVAARLPHAQILRKSPDAPAVLAALAALGVVPVPKEGTP